MGTTKSAIIQAVEARPTTILDQSASSGIIRSITTGWTLLNNAHPETFRLFRVRSCWSIRHIFVTAHNLGSTNRVDIGLYDINDGGNVDSDLYANAELLAPAGVGVLNVDYRYSNTTGSTGPFLSAGNAIWEDLSLSKDPQLEYDFALTTSANGATSGGVVVTLHYVMPG